MSSKLGQFHYEMFTVGKIENMCGSFGQSEASLCLRLNSGVEGSLERSASRHRLVGHRIGCSSSN